MENSKIEWTDHTFSPWIGCSKVHTGCENCYAAEKAARFGVQWGPRGTRRRTADSTWRKVEKWNRQARHAAEQQVQFVREKHRDQVPVVRPRVFASLCDPFEDWGGLVQCRDRELLLEQIRRDYFSLIDRCQNLEFILATKRPDSIRRMWPDIHGAPYIAEAGQMNEFQRGYRENVWLLYSASDQETLEAGLPHLLACRDLVPVLGLSLEPLLGPIVLPAGDGGRGIGFDGAGLDWVIVGGESGPRARACHVDWVRSIIRQCAAAGVACFVKQLGGRAVTRCQSCYGKSTSPQVTDQATQEKVTVRLCRQCGDVGVVLAPIHDRKGGDPAEWPEDLRVRQWPPQMAAHYCGGG